MSEVKKAPPEWLAFVGVMALTMLAFFTVISVIKIWDDSSTVEKLQKRVESLENRAPSNTSYSYYYTCGKNWDSCKAADFSLRSSGAGGGGSGGIKGDGTFYFGK